MRMGAPQVVVYGASGYFGKHLAEKLARKKVPFIAAGRNQDRLRSELSALPALQGAEYEIVAVKHDETALTELMRGKTVVYNLVGPYMQLGEPVLRAALSAGCHYLDCTGEQDWMYMLKAEYADKFADKGLCLLPATAAMWNLGMIAAEEVLQTTGIDTLDIVYCLAGVPSVSSTMSFMRMCCQPQYFLQNKKRVEWQLGGVSISIPGIHETQIALPWGGGGESVWFEDDDRVISCSTLVTFRNPELMKMVTARAQEFAASYRDRPREEQEAATNKWAMEVAPKGDLPREDFDLHRGWISCHGRGRTSARSVLLPAVATGYVGTATIGYVVVDTLLSHQEKATGFVPAYRVAGLDRLMAELKADGVVGEPQDVIR
jgi:Family of unknown function (DUF5938)/Saccharopine dehydrogenase NADP binding domain